MARVVAWGEHDPETLAQAERAARLPVVAGHVALMPDAHIGIGATIGSVIPTEGAIIPSAVGVDIGCGMVAARTDIRAEQLPDDLGPLLRRIMRAVPAGVGVGHDEPTSAARTWLEANPPPDADDKQLRKAARQFGTLGSGNHFLEVCLSERGEVWIVLHSGSRGIGNQLATGHIRRARADAKRARAALDDPDLAYVVAGTPEFDGYIADMRWAQRYAYANRAAMMDAALGELVSSIGIGREVQRVNCHHNFAELERHDGRELWITRKGAIRAGEGDEGIVPGSMGAPTYIVRGKGNGASYSSCAHGAGRRMSRTAARKTIPIETFRAQMQGRTWNVERARALIDESPDAYKDIDEVMAAQTDLVEITERLTQVLNYKGQ